jgi:hypothetical protein
VIVRVGAELTQEQFALANLLVYVERLARPAQRRGLFDAIWDTYGAGVPSRRVRILRALLAEARDAEAAAWQRSAQTALAALAGRAAALVGYGAGRAPR